MSVYAVHVLLRLDASGVSDEVTIEAASVEELLARVRQAVTDWPAFRVLTVLHIEDLPLVLQGAVAAEVGR